MSGIVCLGDGGREESRFPKCELCGVRAVFRVGMSRNVSLLVCRSCLTGGGIRFDEDMIVDLVVSESGQPRDPFEDLATRGRRRRLKDVCGIEFEGTDAP